VADEPEPVADEPVKEVPEAKQEKPTPAPPKQPTDAEIVESYKKLIEACDSLRSANKLITAAGNDPFLRSPPMDQAALAFVSDLVQGNVAKWRQKKTDKQGSLIP